MSDLLWTAEWTVLIGGLFLAIGVAQILLWIGVVELCTWLARRAKPIRMYGRTWEDL